MRSAIDWSYDLLTNEQRELIDELSVFAGGCTLETAEALSTAPDVLTHLTRLVDQSLVLAERDATGSFRYRLLETLREFGKERLQARGAVADVRSRHAAIFTRLAEAAQAGLWAAETRGSWTRRLRSEHDNLRTALRWLIDAGDVERAQQMGTDLWGYWNFSGHVREGRRWLAELLALHGDGPSSTRKRARLLVGAASAAALELDLEAARIFAEEGLDLARQVNDTWAIAYAVFFCESVARNVEHGDQQADALLEEGMAASRLARSRLLEGKLLSRLGLALFAAGNDAAAEQSAQAALAIARSTGVPHEIAVSLRYLASFRVRRADFSSARELLEDALAVLEQEPEGGLMVSTLCTLACVAIDQGDVPFACATLTRGLQLWTEVGRPPGHARGILHALAYLAGAERQDLRLIRLAGALDALSVGLRLSAPISSDLSTLISARLGSDSTRPRLRLHRPKANAHRSTTRSRMRWSASTRAHARRYPQVMPQ